jgi:hypothetical protein
VTEEELAEYEVLIIEFIKLVLSYTELALSRGLKYVFRWAYFEYGLASGGGFAATNKESDRL